jgi:hypothetical protein
VNTLAARIVLPRLPKLPFFVDWAVSRRYNRPINLANVCDAGGGRESAGSPSGQDESILCWPTIPKTGVPS